MQRHKIQPTFVFMCHVGLIPRFRVFRLLCIVQGPLFIFLIKKPKFPPEIPSESTNQLVDSTSWIVVSEGFFGGNFSKIPPKISL